MKIKDIIKLVGGYFITFPNSYEVSSFKTDSRKIGEGDCFIAINSGYLYIDEAISKKCGLIITDKYIEKKTNVGILIVDNAIYALSKIAHQIRCNNKNIPLIAISGSCGKTTTKELIYSILSSKYKVLKSLKNENNIIGLSNTLLNLNDTYDIVLVELGMNHLGELKILSDICNPDLALITNIGTSHIGNLGSIKNIIKAKKEIISGMDSFSTLILNKYDNNSYKIKTDDVICNRCLDIEYDDLEIKDGKLRFVLIYDDQKYKIVFDMPNIKMKDNIMEAIQACLYFNMDIKDIVNIINNFKLDNRMITYKCNNYTIIDDSYNSSYESIEAVIPYLKSIDNLIIVIGDVLELGSYSKYYHKKVNKLLKKIKCDIITVGEYSKYIKGTHYNNNEEVLQHLNSINKEGKTIYFKASNKINLKEIVNALLKEYEK